jgi:hypothetical protein
MWPIHIWNVLLIILSIADNQRWASLPQKSNGYIFTVTDQIKIVIVILFLLTAPQKN